MEAMLPRQEGTDDGGGGIKVKRWGDWRSGAEAGVLMKVRGGATLTSSGQQGLEAGLRGAMHAERWV